MKASELKPSQWFEWDGYRGLCLKQDGRDTLVYMPGYAGDMTVMRMDSTVSVVLIPECDGWEPGAVRGHSNSFAESLDFLVAEQNSEIQRLSELGDPFHQVRYRQGMRNAYRVAAEMARLSEQRRDRQLSGQEEGK